MFFSYLNSLVTLDARTHALVESAVVRSEIKRKTILQQAGSVCRQFHFVEKGMLRVYYYKDGKDVTAWFAFEGMVASCIDSLFSGKTTMYYIEALQDAVVHTIRYEIIERSFDGYPQLERLGRLMVTENYLLLDERMKLIIFHSAEERYQMLLEREPQALQKIPLNHIASYLNVTQETLSRIRSKQ